jgi:hypothetical protein
LCQQRADRFDTTDLDLGAEQTDYRMNTIKTEIGRITQIFNEQYLVLNNEIG